MRGFMLGAALAVALGLPALSAVETFPLMYKETPEPTMVYLYDMQWAEKPPTDAGAMPDFGESKAWFSELRLGDGPPMLIALAQEAAKTKDVPRSGTRQEMVTPSKLVVQRLYLDLDGDGSLADEDPPALAEETTSDGLDATMRGGMQLTPVITVPIILKLSDGRVVKRDFRFKLATYPFMVSSPYLIMQVLDGWIGTICLGDAEAKITIMDADANGKPTPGDPTRARSDMLKLEAKSADRGTHYHGNLTRYVLVDDRLWRLGVSEDGTEVKVQPFEGEPGKLAISGTDGKGHALSPVSVYVSGANLSASLMAKGEPFALPRGEYRLYYTIAKDRNKPPQYSFSCPSSVTLAAGKTTKLACGGPLKLAISARQYHQASKGINLSITISPRTVAGHSFSCNVWPRPKKGPAHVEVFTSGFRKIGSADASFG